MIKGKKNHVTTNIHVYDCVLFFSATQDKVFASKHFSLSLPDDCRQIGLELNRNQMVEGYKPLACFIPIESKRKCWVVLNFHESLIWLPLVCMCVYLYARVCLH